MVTRRALVGGAAIAGAIALLPDEAAYAASDPVNRWDAGFSANGWPIAQANATDHRVTGSTATVALRPGITAAVLLHVARRWHYEIAALDSHRGASITGFTTERTVAARFESNYLSGTALAICPTAYPVNGVEPMPPHLQTIIRDILADCEGTVAWGGDLKPAKASHFQIDVPPRDARLRSVATRLDTRRHRRSSSQTAGAVADPAEANRRQLAHRWRRAG